MLLVGSVGICFILELLFSSPKISEVLYGYLPVSLLKGLGQEEGKDMMYVGMGILGGKFSLLPFLRLGPLA